MRRALDRLGPLVTDPDAWYQGARADAVRALAILDATVDDLDAHVDAIVPLRAVEETA